MSNTVSHLWTLTNIGPTVARCDNCELRMVNLLSVLTGFPQSESMEDAARFTNETFESQGQDARLVTIYDGQCVACGAQVEAQVAS